MIVGIDLAGDEHYTIKEGDNVHKAFVLAKTNGVNRTIHAGESSSAHEIIRAIELCDVTRIGHGYRMFYKKDETDDDDTMAKACKLVKDRNIHLEMCPRSSILLKSALINNHPLVKAVAMD
mmetsp:Transcript_53025/g.44469  ORF Transcript_53025/g.44469 Transcript_53025/m.44469 type:complete len:121 (+) Transcript_53025:514-876(+)